MHSPSEMISLNDVNNVAELIAETCRTVTSKTDFTAR
jgi:putative aminopeptidase FrvX